MGALTGEMTRSLLELQLGFKGELTMSQPMEDLMNSLYMEKIPTWWGKLGFPSTRPLASWLSNLKERCGQLDEWCGDPITIPKVVDIAKLFNPQSYLTVINCKAGPASDNEKGVYICPTYSTPQRRPFYVFPAQLRTKYPAAKWTLGGVA